MPAAQNASSRKAAFFTAMLSPAASEVAETRGAAARMSTAAAAREFRRRPATAARAANQARSMSMSSCRPSSASPASARRNAGIQTAASQGVSASSARAPVSGTATRRSFFPRPEADQGGADRRTGTALAVAVDPLAHAVRGGEQRGAPGLCRQASLRLLDVTLLVEVRCHQPLMQVQRMAGGIEDGTAVDDAERTVHAESKTFEHGGEVPGVDRVAVDRGLAAHRIEPGAMEKGRQQRVAGERLVEPGYGRGRPRQGTGERRIEIVPPRRPQQRLEHVFPPLRPAVFRWPLTARWPRSIQSTTCTLSYLNYPLPCNSLVIPQNPLPFLPYAR